MSSPNLLRGGGFDMRQFIIGMLNRDESSTVATEEDDEVVFPGDSLPGDEAEDEWSGESSSSFSFYFVKQFAYDDPDIKAKIDEADHEIYHCNSDRIHIANTLKSKRAERSSLVASRDNLISSLDELHEINYHQSMTKEVNEVEQEQEVFTGQIHSLSERLGEIKMEIEMLNVQMACVLDQRDKAFDRIKFLRMQRDKGNAAFFQSRVVMRKAKEFAASRNVIDLEDLSHSEVEKFMSRWNSDKAFRDDYEKRILPSLDERKLRCDGRSRDSEGDVDSENGNDTAREKATDQLKRLSTEDESDDEDTLKKKKREEQLEKARLAMERKRKLHEKAAAKAAIRVKKEAEKKLKEHEKKRAQRNKKAAAFNSSSSDVDRTAETVVEASEPEKEKRLDGRSVFPKQRSFRGNGKVNEAVPKAILKRRKAYRLWVWTVSCAALALLLFLLILFFYLR